MSSSLSLVMCIYIRLIRVLFFFFAIKNARGFSSNFIIVDEGAFVKEGPFFNTILPVWRNDDAVLVALSSPKDKNNFFSRLSKMENKNGESVCLTIRTELACNDCKKNPETMHECKHMRHMAAQWHTDEKSEQLTSLMGDRKDVIQQELLGIPTDSEEMQFASDHLDYMFNEAYFEDTTNIAAIDVAYVTCDPSGGGFSDLTFACAALVNKRWVVSFFY